MPVQLTAREERSSAGLTCAFVNNMPDSAFENAERQYVGLIEAAAGGRTVSISRHTMAGVPRAGTAADRVAAEYEPLSEVLRHPPDFVIVTGSNPIHADIADEPYWDEMVGLFEWARQEVGGLLVSCLAAHGALGVYDGLARRRLEAKCTGVFAQEAERSHPLADGLAPPLVLPHSRWNTVDDGELAEAGYDVALHTVGGGWSVATRTVGRALVAVVQGHPEYGPDTLLLEYQRDVRRYVTHEQDELPFLPPGCVGRDDWETLEALHGRVLGGERDPGLVETFDFVHAGARAPWPWRPLAVGLYQNWLAAIAARSD